MDKSKVRRRTKQFVPFITCYPCDHGIFYKNGENGSTLNLFFFPLSSPTKKCEPNFPRLSKNYIEILKNDKYYDITIEVGEDPNVKIFCAHGYLVLSFSFFTTKLYQ